MNKIIVLALVLMFLPLVSSLTSDLPSAQQGRCTQLIQTCDNCTYVNLTTYQYASGAIANVNAQMQQLAPSSYNYTWCGNNQIGTSIYCATGDPNGQVTTQCTSYDITPNGATNNIWFWILLVGIVYGIGFIGYFGKNEWVSIIGGLGMISLGVYIAGSGIDIYRDYITRTISTLSIGLGALFSIHAGVEVIQDNV